MNGEVLAGRYRLLSLLGRGGVGEVWRAEDLQLGRPVAIKLLRRLEGDALSSLERFRREARLTANLSHPNIVATYDVGTTDDRAYLVMELVRGGDLAQLLRSHGLPPTEEVADLAIQAARGLDAAHAAGVVHRDVKPANLLLSSDGMLKITDFGIARMTGTENTGGLTGPVLLGTAAYLAPEQVRGQRAIPASDRYALGCVLYELLTGRTPFTGEAHEVLDGHVHSEPVPVLEYRPDAGAGLADLVMRLLAKDPSARPSTAAEAEACLGATGVAEPPPTEVIALPELAPDEDAELGPSRLSPNARRAALVGVVAAAVLLVALGVAKLASDDDTPLAEVSPPSVKPTATATTSTPTQTPTVVHKTTTPTPTPTATPTSQADRLRALADLLRKEDAHGRTARMLREAAHDLDEAAAKLAEGDADGATGKMQDAFRRLGEAQRDGRWQPTPQEIQQLRQLGPLPTTNGDGQQND